ncbi:putative Dol-P-Glc:Glc(2)Man(9)GlcNAc(2)-PP-Dol alpha-1,2-glucosyltransferase [Nilaparvata lugens]|uniref:putative Dol-P-Glc:Glc(2)Man(9)GlcNAc(2)-PP-Dol alpha-1,2-glucosyltransferase n=1 Tax=Nilaparvata lugens TaxID=108931 RepID=UPI00193E165D|nr:putative Dol-P-Glc:Glc(2)Man(9)GlcNAc(2)-PP-Dol alpha-1,2-glucosyltransferase [Nilaparvata lugens]
MMFYGYNYYVHSLKLGTCFSLYMITSVIVFNYVYEAQPKPFIDEIFHVPQAQKFCNGTFNEWDAKITTLPGVYLISVGALKPLASFMDNVCSVYGLRLTNLVACLINFYLFYKLIKSINHIESVKNSSKALLCGLNMACFPVLYFLSFLYYTDVISVFLILLTMSLHYGKLYNTAAVTGFISVGTRQTNIVWIFLIAIDGLIQYLNPYIMKTKLTQKVQSSSNYVKIFLMSIPEIKDKWLVFLGIFEQLGGYLLVGISFCVFLFLNGGIVVGDKENHSFTVHIPQIFYFSLFYLGFALPFCVTRIKPFLFLCKKQWKLIIVFVASILIIVHFNTLVHPFLLADNRHYTFYVWKKLFENPIPFRYLISPVYIFGIYCINCNLAHLNFIHKCSFYVLLAFCLVPQKLVEVRYFVIPYLFLRLHLKDVRWWQLICEFILYNVINFITVYIFLTKTFYWSDSKDAQRIMW